MTSLFFIQCGDHLLKQRNSRTQNSQIIRLNRPGQRSSADGCRTVHRESMKINLRHVSTIGHTNYVHNRSALRGWNPFPLNTRFIVRWEATQKLRQRFFVLTQNKRRDCARETINEFTRYHQPELDKPETLFSLYTKSIEIHPIPRPSIRQADL